jgi:acyl-CoA synthetase (AMP-forming)/AMP-acid ligase II
MMLPQDYPVVVYALLQTTIPVALLNSHSTAPELVHQLKLARVTHLVVGPSSVPVGKQALKLAGLSNVGITILEGSGKKSRTGEVSLQQLVERTKKRGVQPVGITHAKHETLAYLVFSSGTSGLPKGMPSVKFTAERSQRRRVTAVMISHGNLNTCYAQVLIWAFHAFQAQPVRKDESATYTFIKMENV